MNMTNVVTFDESTGEVLAERAVAVDALTHPLYALGGVLISLARLSSKDRRIALLRAATLLDVQWPTPGELY